ncbi:hypothetical protein HPP92_024908 [Vanilla planifolia]|uniref:Aminotransferase class I/classII large domain-containing protein n=1 Tax=Vanilla planifolia TaxID=51239 RepID=A0A835U8P4_VANPL|nr:hypothetical protein HPP92_025191 [Vanilla planifolia]KAG0453604.1 hypothetical protein HPP92_024908 [Vanilla planifolia]
MELKLSSVARMLTTSPIQELSHLAQRHGAINLAEGFPDFPAPLEVKTAAISAINTDFNQYRHVQSICELLEEKMKREHSLEVNALTDFVICCGQTEAFAATIFAIVEEGDEVILFDPAYETYESCISLAGGIPVYVLLDPPYWTLDVEKFAKSFTNKTKAVVLNSPHNPTGKVYTAEELEVIAGACHSHNCFAITDEVYEHITFDAHKHVSLASFPGMQERTIITSSLSKTFGITGWRIGWACTSANIASAIRNIHIKLTDSAPAPFQEAAVTALKMPPGYYTSLKISYEAKRDKVVEMLSSLGFQIKLKPQGSVFVFAELPENWPNSDVDFVRELIKEAGVAAVPGRGFFHGGNTGYGRFVRFAFCKSDQTLETARRGFETWRMATLSSTCSVREF